MKINLLMSALAFLLLLSCSTKEMGGKDLEKKLQDLTIQKLKADLKSSESYQPGQFRIETSVPNDTILYPFLLDSIYMGKYAYEIMERDLSELQKGDTVYQGRFYVIHSYRAKNGLGVLLDGMIQISFDSHLKLIGMSKYSDRDDRGAIKRFKQNGFDVKPLLFDEPEK